MTNQQMIAYAMTGGTRVRPFIQPSPHCAAYVGWWLRSRIQGKDYFSEKRFNPGSHMNPEGAYLNQQRAFSEVRTNFESNERGRLKAATLQNLTVNTGRKAVQDYITLGERVDKGSSEKTPIAFLLNDVAATKISIQPAPTANTAGIANSFDFAIAQRVYCRYSVATMSNSHSAGLDCSNPGSIAYFEPNLGEFTFSSLDNLKHWWEVCYINRADGAGNAFKWFAEYFAVEYYRKEIVR